MVKAEKVIKRPRGRPPTKHKLDDATTATSVQVNQVDSTQQQEKKKKKNKHKNQYSTQANNNQYSNSNQPKIYKNSNKQHKSLYLSNKAASFGKHGDGELLSSSLSSFPQQTSVSSVHLFPKSVSLSNSLSYSQMATDTILPYAASSGYKTILPMPPLSSSAFQSISNHRYPQQQHYEQQQQQQHHQYSKKQHSLSGSQNNSTITNMAPSSSSSSSTTAANNTTKLSSRDARHTAYPVDRILSQLMMNEPLSLATLTNQLSDELPKEIIQSTLEILQILGIVIRVKAFNLNSSTTTSFSSSTSSNTSNAAAALAAANSVATKESSLLFTMNHHAKSSEIVDIADMVAVTASKRQNAANIRSRIQLLQELSMQQDLSVSERRIQFKQLLESLIQRDHYMQSQSQSLQQSTGARGGIHYSSSLGDDRLYRELLKQLVD